MTVALVILTLYKLEPATAVRSLPPFAISFIVDVERVSVSFI